MALFQTGLGLICPLAVFVSNAITTSPLYTFVSVLGPVLLVVYTTPLSTLISSLFLNHQLYADNTQLFLYCHPSELHSNITHLQNVLQQISSWMTANLLTLNSDLNNNFLKCMTPLSLQPALLATLALFFMNTLPSQTKFLHFRNPATITFVKFAVSAHISTSK